MKKRPQLNCRKDVSVRKIVVAQNRGGIEFLAVRKLNLRPRLVCASAPSGQLGRGASQEQCKREIRKAKRLGPIKPSTW